jgi:hypothetical protein
VVYTSGMKDVRGASSYGELLIKERASVYEYVHGDRAISPFFDIDLGVGGEGGSVIVFSILNEISDELFAQFTRKYVLLEVGWTCYRAIIERWSVCFFETCQ